MNAIEEKVEDADLVYVEDSVPGISRRRQGRGFSYRYPHGGVVRDKALLARIKDLVIPPAWEEVWICPEPRGHLQATGRDAAGRKQYRYHDRWSELSNGTKFDHLIEFALALPSLRRKIARDLSRFEGTKERLSALALAILDRTHIRVGNEVYVESNNTYGLTTLESRHVDVSGPKIHFEFRGKGGKEQSIDLRDKRLAKAILKCQQLPGQHLFACRDGENQVIHVRSEDVNRFIKESIGESFTAKTFRTWAGTVEAVAFLCSRGIAPEKEDREKNRIAAIKHVAKLLGNTPASCRKYYIHPLVLQSYEDGEFFDILKRRRARKKWSGLKKSEKDTLKLLTSYREHF